MDPVVNQPVGGPVSAPEGDLRVFYAAQRTMLAWVRTGVALMGFGFVVARFGLFMREIAVARELATHAELAAGPRTGLSVWAGTGLLAVGVAVMVMAAARFRAFAGNFARGLPVQATGVGPELIVAATVAGIGVVLMMYLMVLL